MSHSYAAAGVDISAVRRGGGALVDVLRTARIDRPSASVLQSGHYASVLRVAPNLGIAISTDGVGSKLVIAEQADRLETVGIDCIAMNVNDVICVGAEPIALVDYLAVEEPDPARLGRIAQGLRAGAEQANIEIPGGELAVIPSSSAAIRRPAASTSARRASERSRSTHHHRRAPHARRRAASACLPAASTPTATRWRARRCWDPAAWPR